MPTDTEVASTGSDIGLSEDEYYWLFKQLVDEGYVAPERMHDSGERELSANLVDHRLVGQHDKQRPRHEQTFSRIPQGKVSLDEKPAEPNPPTPQPGNREVHAHAYWHCRQRRRYL